MSYIWVRTDKQDMGKQCYPLLEHACKPQLHTVEFGVDLANVSKEVNPGLEKQILFNKSCRYFVQHDPALTTAWQLHSGLNLFEGMCKNPLRPFLCLYFILVISLPLILSISHYRWRIF